MSQIYIVSNDDNIATPIYNAMYHNFKNNVSIIPDIAPNSLSTKFVESDTLIIDLQSLLQNRCLHRPDSLRIDNQCTIILVPVEKQSQMKEIWTSHPADEIYIRPTNEKQMEQLVQFLLKKIIINNELQKLRENLNKQMGKSQIIAKSRRMQEIMYRLPQIANSSSTVLINGETGTGKELIARAIHYLGPLAGQPFITVDCGAIPDNLVENELFGHVQGAYTGASSSAKGLLYEAQGGSLFLDEIESLPLTIQSKFLRFLQERQYKPLGQTKYIPVNTRVLAATNIDLLQAVEEKKFRKDLFYRINVIPLFIPPLRDRKEDIPALIHHFLLKYSQGTKTEIPKYVVDDWISYQWPGNVRELENKVQAWIINKSTGCLFEESGIFNTSTRSIRPLTEVRKEIMEKCDQTYLQNLLTITNGNISSAARLASLNRKSLGEILKKYHINPQNFRK